MNDSLEIAENKPKSLNSHGNKTSKRPLVIGLCVVAVIGMAFVMLPIITQEDATELADRVRAHPTIIEQLGGIDDCSYSFMDSLTGEKRTDIYDVRGPKGDGKLITYVVRSKLLTLCE